MLGDTKMNFQLKTIDKIEWIKAEIKKGTPKARIKEGFLAKWQIHFTGYYDYYHLATTGEYSKSSRNCRMRAKKSTKVALGEPEVCFFDGVGNLQTHHISYIPEVTIRVTEVNHKRLHRIVKEYHEQIIAKDEVIRQLTTKLETIKRCLG